MLALALQVLGLVGLVAGVVLAFGWVPALFVASLFTAAVGLALESRGAKRPGRPKGGE